MKSHPCGFCGRRFWFFGGLMRHILRRHRHEMGRGGTP